LEKGREKTDVLQIEPSLISFLTNSAKHLRFKSNEIGLRMQHSIKVGFSFGVTSGIITTLGLIVGLHSGTHSKVAIIGGVLTIAVADALSDALGIHMSEESENKHTAKEIWMSTISTLISKFIFALTFILPILLFKLTNAIIISIIWGLSVLGIFCYLMAREQKKKAWKIILEHELIAVVVIILTHYIGKFIAIFFVK
jgi:VIT1/CCC1 family predicted Fe2+/Mn2+ transporter